jgi:hypothetical protein
MSYYDNPQSQWSSSTQQQTQNNWEHQGSTTPVRAGASGPQPQDDYAFSYQFDEVDRAYENLQKSGKGYGMGGRRESMIQRSFNVARGPDTIGRPSMAKRWNQQY